MFLSNCLGHLEAKYTGTMAYLYFFGNVFTYSLLSLLYKTFILRGYPFHRLLLSRYFLAIIINTWLINRGNEKIYFGDQPRVQRGLYYRIPVCLCVFAGIYGGMSFMPITDSVVLQQLTPIVTGILNALVFKAEYTK